MISTVTGISFGTLLRDARRRTIDPSTGSPYTQVRLGALIGVSDSQISKWEHGEGVPSPEVASELARLLDGVSVASIAEAVGFDLEPSSLTGDERELLRMYRRLGPDLRDTALRVVSALPVPQQYRQSNAS